MAKGQIKRMLKEHQLEEDTGVSGSTTVDERPHPDVPKGGTQAGKTFTQRTMTPAQHKAEQDVLNAESEKKYQEFKARKYRNR